MSDTLCMPRPENDYEAAKRQYVEFYASTAVTNTNLRIAVVALSAVCVALVALNVKTYQSSRNVKPWVIRISDTGRAEAVPYASFEYRPQENEIRYFLTEFVQRHYGRMRATVRENYARSLYYLDGRLADALIEANKKNKTIENFLAGAGEEIDINVKNVSIEDLRQPPYRAVVDFEKIYYGSADHAELRREKYVANFVFVVKERVPNSMIPVNPLGLTITYFREDQAFQ
jgi:type IV secretory pathway TrbF-like protein